MAKLPSPSETPKMQDHIFISYSSKDRAFVDQLASELRKLGHTVWVDFEDIHSGEKWKQSISDGLHPSRVVLLVLSPDSIQSEWVEEEIRTAQSLEKKIIPLLLRPLPENISSDILRETLSEIHYRDFTGGFQQPFEQLLEHLPKPEGGIRGYCSRLIAQIASQPWGLDHYIQEEAKLLPIHASPYDEGITKHTRENLIHRLKENKRTIVLGEPGMGKSVALERLAWELASAEPPIVPIIINLREYDGQSLLEWLRLTLISSGDPAIRRALRRPDAIEQYLHDIPNIFYILLDGLNEVRPNYREILLPEIRRLSLTFPQYPIAITSRIQDESWRELRGGSFNAETFVVQSIYENQSQAYLIAHLGDDEALDLWQRLDQRMRGLTTTPLLLWMVKEAWLESKGRVPGNRGELYSSFIERMLRRDDERKLNANVSKEDRLTALKKLALIMHNQQAVTLPYEQVCEIIPHDILEALRVNGILQGEKIIRFAPHQTIQEHFTARAIQTGVEAELNRPLPRWWQKILSTPQDSLLDLAMDAWWMETFIQLAGIIQDPNRLAQKIAERNPWVAWWCVQEGQSVDPETERIIQEQSEKLVDSNQVTDRRNVVQALLKLPRARVIDLLAKLAVDGEETISRPAYKALKDLGDVGTHAIEQAFAHNFDKNIHRIDDPIQRAEYGQKWAKYDKRQGVNIIVQNGIKQPDIEWVMIPASDFTYQDGKMTLDYNFQIARYPVTYIQFQVFVDDPEGFHDPRWWKDLSISNGYNKTVIDQVFKYSNYPRERVSWYDAMAFCRWYSWRLGGGYTLSAIDQWAVRLPTEFEWEKAARANTGWTYPYGDTFNALKGNTIKTGTEQTSSVGLFSAGDALHWEKPISDLSGNVWEWCLTDYNNPQTKAKRENLRSNVRRVLRGGSWGDDDNFARAVFRYYGSQDFRVSFGFRLVRVPSQKQP